MRLGALTSLSPPSQSKDNPGGIRRAHEVFSYFVNGLRRHCAWWSAHAWSPPSLTQRSAKENQGAQENQGRHKRTKGNPRDPKREREQQNKGTQKRSGGQGNVECLIAQTTYLFNGVGNLYGQIAVKELGSRSICKGDRMQH